MKKFYLLVLTLLMLRTISVNAQPNVIDPADPDNVFTSLNQPPLPPNGVIAKWGHMQSMNWNTSGYKAYYYNGMPFRVRFPKSYQPNVPDGRKYPILVVLHGAGEAGGPYDNESHLFNGGDFFDNAVNLGFDCFVFFEQSSNGFHSNYFPLITPVLDSMAKYCKVDINRVVVTGLSSGGQGTWEFMAADPKYLASTVPISGARSEYIPQMPSYVHIPVWLFNGGQDTNPDPATAQSLVDAFTSLGGNIKHTVYPSEGHFVWYNAWGDPGFLPYVLAANKANPLVYFGRTDFCVGDNINVKLGLTPGFNAYQWQKDGTTIAGATLNTLTVSQLGTYKARFQRLPNGPWSDWSPTPVVIKTKSATQTPDIQVNGTRSRVLPAPDTSTTVPLILPDGYTSYTWVRLPDSAIVASQKTFNAPVGLYIAKVTEQYGCSSKYSNSFKVVNAGGSNAPDAATNLAAVSKSKTSIQLTWANNPNPVNNEAGFEVYRSLKPGGPYKLVTINPADNLSYLDQGLIANTSYFYIVRAVNNNGAAANSNEAGSKTQVDNTPPTAPSNLQIVQTTNNSAELKWGASTDDVGVVKYDVYINGSKTYSTTNIDFTAFNLTQQSYIVAVKARDAAGNSSNFSNQIVVNLGSVNPNPKFMVRTLFSAIAPAPWNNMTGSTLLNLVNSNNVVTNVAVRFSTPSWWGTYNAGPSTGNNSGVYPDLVMKDVYYFGILGGPETVNVTVSGLTPSTSYNFKFFASSIYPDIPDNGTTIFTIGAQSAPLYVQNNTQNTANINGAVSDNSGNIVFTMSKAAGSVVGFLNAFEFQPASTVNDGLKPLRPTNISATQLSSGIIQIGWNDVAYNEKSYNVYRSTDSLGTYKLLNPGAVNANAITFNDSSTVVMTKYFYKVQAVNTNGSSDFSDVVSILTTTVAPRFLVRTQFTDPAPAPWNNLTGSTLLNLKNTSNVTTGVSVRFSTPSWWGTYNAGPSTGNNSGVYPDVVLKDVYYFGILGGPETASVTVSGLTPGALYNFKFFASSVYPDIPDNGTTIFSIGATSVPLYVQNNTQNTANINGAVADGSGNIVFTMSKAQGSVVGFLNAFEFGPATGNGLVPAKPTNITLTSLTGGVVKVGWTDAANNEKRYDVYRSTDIAGTYQLLNPAATNANAVSYNDSTTAAATKYFYKVQGVNDNGGSPFSDTVFIVTQNNNSPKITGLNNVSIKSGSTANVAFTATDDPGEIVKVAGSLPLFATLQSLGNGNYNIALAPTNANIGVTNASVTATDNHGGTTTYQFQITVNDKNSTSVYVNFGSDTAAAGLPWNNILGYAYGTRVTSNLKDESGNTTPISLTYVDTWQGAGEYGMNTGGNTGIFPDAVLKSSIYESSTSARRITLSGLSASKLYNIVVIGSLNGGYNANATYTSGAQSVQLNATYNSSKSVQLNGLQADGTGSITVTITKDAAATTMFLNALVIQSYDASVGILNPKDVAVEPVHNSRTVLNVRWSDRSNNETGMEVWRATSSTGPFTRVATLPVNTTSYSDQGLTPNTRYFYEVRAVNASIQSEYSNVASAVTPNSNVLVNFTWHYPTTVLPWNNTGVNPQTGDMYGNLKDGQLNNTGMALTVIKDFNGEYSGGMNPGGNSGIFPDSVLISNYWVDKGQVATLKLDGLDQSKKYRIGFEGSATWTGDMTATMTINGKTGYLNTYLNTSKVVYLDNLVPNTDGEINIDFSATGSYGFIGSVVIQSYTDSDASSIGGGGLQGVRDSLLQSNSALMISNMAGEDIIDVKAYPNPFVQNFDMTFSNLKSGKRLTVELYNLAGAALYRQDYELAAGSGKITVPGYGLAPGGYLARIYENGKLIKAFKLVKVKN